MRAAWLFVAAGALAFVPIFVYDLLSLRTGRRSWVLFVSGGALLTAATAGLLFAADLPASCKARPAGCALCLAAAAAMLFFLVKALFFSFPPAQGYAGGGRAPAVTSGLYALCRHPGVLFLGGFYLFVWLAAPCWPLFAAFALFTALDTVLAFYEDCAVFPALLDGYAAYRHTTPFLLPDKASFLRACRKTR